MVRENKKWKRCSKKQKKKGSKTKKIEPDDDRKSDDGAKSNGKHSKSTKSQPTEQKTEPVEAVPPKESAAERNSPEPEISESTTKRAGDNVAATEPVQMDCDDGDGGGDSKMSQNDGYFLIGRCFENVLSEHTFLIGGVSQSAHFLIGCHSMDFSDDEVGPVESAKAVPNGQSEVIPGTDPVALSSADSAEEQNEGVVVEPNDSDPGGSASKTPEDPNPNALAKKEDSSDPEDVVNSEEDPDSDSDSESEGEETLNPMGSSSEHEARGLIESFLELKEPQINWKMIEFLSKVRCRRVSGILCSQHVARTSHFENSLKITKIYQKSLRST